MKKIIIIVVVLIALLAVGSLFRGGKAQGPQWTTQKVDTGDIAVTISASGSVEPVNSVQVGSQVSGIIKEVLVQPDQRVKRGDCLARIDPELLEAEHKDKDLYLKQAQSNLALLAVERENLALREQRTKLSITRTKVTQERAAGTLVLAAKNMQRALDLLQTNATAQSDVDSRVLEKENAERDLQLQRVDLDQLSIELLQIVADRKSLAARETQAALVVGQAEQALAKAAANLSYTSIVSPIDGMVLERAVDPGQTLAAMFQAPNLFKIVSDLSVVRIQAQIDEADVGKIRSDQKVTFDVDAFKGEQFSGVVKAVRLKNETRANLITYPVIIEAQNPFSPEQPNGKLRPGMTAYLTFEVEHRKNVTRVPAAALRFSPPDGVTINKGEVKIAEDAEKKTEPKDKNAPPLKGMPATVYVLDKQDRLKALPVRVGESDTDYYELLSGNVKPGDELVTEKRADKPPATPDAE